MNSSGVLSAYFRQRDTDTPMDALTLLSDDVNFALLPVPGVQLVGVGRERLRAELGAMPTTETPHHELVIEGGSSDGTWEFVLGHRIVDGERTGVFIAVAESGADAMTQYFGAFIPGANVSPRAGAAT